MRFITVLALLATPVFADTFYVATTGSDSDIGSEAAPWLTIQHAEDNVGAGDSVIIGEGTYAERVTVNASGADGSPITFSAAEGETVSMGGFNIYGEYVTIEGIEITGALATPSGIEIQKGANNVTISDCYIHHLTLGVHGIRCVAGTGKDETSNLLVDGCTIYEPGYDHIQLRGANHIVRNCTLTNVTGDFMRAFGHGHVIENNEFSGTSEVTVGHQDIIQTFGLNGEVAYDITFSNNYCHDTVSQLCQLSAGWEEDVRDWTFKNNLYVNMSMAANCTLNGCKWYGNTFYKCAQNTGHVIFINYYDPELYEPGDPTYRGTSHDAEIINNVFLENSITPGNTGSGWYLCMEGNTNFTADYNYVAGTSYAAKNETNPRTSVGWQEDNGINGGDPSFLDESDPEGPDELIWTRDDGFKPETGSLLIGAGSGGTDIGVYSSYPDDDYYYVATDGNDSADGSSATPWLTIQKAANTLTAGDTVIVRAGNYDERPATQAGGTGNHDRITYQADGVVTCDGFDVEDPYVTLDGFTVEAHSNAVYTVAAVNVDPNADHFLLVNNTIKDGIWLKRSDFVFDGTEKTISTATGGFVAAGFRSGITVKVYWAERFATLENRNASVLVDSVTDTTLTLDAGASVTSEGPVGAYLTGSSNYGVYIESGADYGIFQKNTLENLSYHAARLQGNNCIYKLNTFTELTGWDAIIYAGSYNSFTYNFIHSSPLQMEEVSPDAFVWYPALTQYVTFENNYVDFAGAIGYHHGEVGESSNITFNRNVFVNTEQAVMGHPYTTFSNNTFYHVARKQLSVVAAADHPIALEETATNSTITDNIFLGCGYLESSPDTHGWYETAAETGFSADYNFVAGPASSFSTKTGWPESREGLNGGDPGFVDAASPLGADGIPWTDDDGLRLTEGSKLVGAGTGSNDLGAYEGTGEASPASPYTGPSRLDGTGKGVRLDGTGRGISLGN